ncbi:lipopolysaccharide core heptose(II) kinase RfaY [Escherichia coli]|nr:lipopolysaccharide core heptose(II) kinase RfaY [Escherichia coli]
MHQHGMVSGDPHKGNFIVSEKGLRLIDLSGKNNRCFKSKRSH